MSLFILVLELVGTIGAIISVGMMIWHTFGMIRGIRGAANWGVNLIPFIALALSGSLDTAGQIHRSKAVIWGAISAVLVIGVVIAQHIEGV